MKNVFIGLRHWLAAFVLGLNATNARCATLYTGDTIEGVRVISQLDVNDLESGKKYRGTWPVMLPPSSWPRMLWQLMGATNYTWPKASERSQPGPPLPRQSLTRPEPRCRLSRRSLRQQTRSPFRSSPRRWASSPLGARSALGSGAPVLKLALRRVVFGALAMALTVTIGGLVGKAISSAMFYPWRR